MTPPDSEKSRFSDSGHTSRRNSRFLVWAAIFVGLGVPVVCFWRALKVLFGFGPDTGSLVPMAPDVPPPRDYELAVFLIFAAAPLLIYAATRAHSRRRR